MSFLGLGKKRARELTESEIQALVSETLAQQGRSRQDACPKCGAPASKGESCGFGENPKLVCTECAAEYPKGRA